MDDISKKNFVTIDAWLKRNNTSISEVLSRLTKLEIKVAELETANAQYREQIAILNGRLFGGGPTT